jgi:hypothetical protein
MGGVYSTGPLVREKDDEHENVKGKVTFMTDNSVEYLLVVYNPKTQDLIHEESGVTTEELTCLKYKVSSSDDSWVAFLITDDELALVNIFHSIDDHHRPSLCFNFTTSIFFLLGAGQESQSVSAKSKVPKLSDKLLSKLSKKSSAKLESMKSKKMVQ